MSGKRKKSGTKSKNTPVKLLSGTGDVLAQVAMGFLALLLLIPPFFRGLFFPEDQVRVLICALILAMLIAFHVWHCRQNKIGNLTFLSHPLDYFMLALPGVYLLSFFTAANPGLALHELVENTLYFVIFWCSARLLTTRQSVNRILAVIYLAAIGLSLAGLATATGFIHIKDGYVGWRIASSFQYANALASYLGAALIIGIYFTSQLVTSNNRGIKAWDNARFWVLGTILAAGNYLILLVFIATGSRGGLLVLALALPLFILLNRNLLKLPLLLAILIAAIGAIPGSVMFTRYMQVGEITTAWLYVLLGLALVIVLQLVILLLLTKTARQYIWAGLAGFVVLATIGTTYLSDKLGLTGALARFDIFNINILEIRSAVDRFEFMGTALVMIKERPFIGWGGGGWQEAYLAFQEYHFISRQVHSYFFQVGVETGTLGLLVVFGIWALFFFAVYKLFRQGNRDIAVLLGAVGLFIGGRAAIDFDLSLAALTMMLMTCFGAARGLSTPKEPAAKISGTKNNRQLIAALALITVLLIGAGILSSANASLKQSYAYIQQKNIQAALEQAETAASKNPFNHEISLYLSSLRSALGDSAGAEQELRKAVRKSPYNPRVRAQIADFLLKHKKYAAALVEAEKAIALAPLQVIWYERLARVAILAALDKTEKGELDAVKTYTEIVLNLPPKMMARYDALSEKHQRLWISGHRINNPTAELHLRLGQAHGLQGDYQAALEQLNIAVQHIPAHKATLKGEALFWQAAVLKKQGKKEEAAKASTAAEQLWPNGKNIYEKLTVDWKENINAKTSTTK